MHEKGRKTIHGEMGVLRTYDGWLQVHKDGPWHMLASSRLAEERVEGVVTAPGGLV